MQRLSFMTLKRVWIRCLMITAIAMQIITQAHAQSETGDISRIIVSPFTHHHSRSAEHRTVWLVGMEQESANRSLRGAAFFSNSFGQESVYIFPWGGRYNNVFGNEAIFAKWTAGLLYGYKAPYENKVPFNHKGFSPAIVPSIGYQFNSRVSAEVQILGTAGIMLTFGYRYE
jgi:hypothetical protein